MDDCGVTLRAMDHREYSDPLRNRDARQNQRPSHEAKRQCDTRQTKEPSVIVAPVNAEALAH